MRTRCMVLDQHSGHIDSFWSDGTTLCIGLFDDGISVVNQNGAVFMAGAQHLYVPVVEIGEE